MNTKICTKCRQEKPLNEFYKDCCKSDGLQSTCKVCSNEYQRQYLQKRKLATTTTLSNGDPSYSHLNDREVQEQVKSLLNELRNRGWQVECSIAYLHTKKL